SGSSRQNQIKTFVRVLRGSVILTHHRILKREGEDFKASGLYRRRLVRETHLLRCVRKMLLHSPADQSLQFLRALRDRLKRQDRGANDAIREQQALLSTPVANH